LKKKITLGTALVLVLFAILLTFQITYSFVGNEYQNKVDTLTGDRSDFSLLVYADDLIRNNFYQSIDDDALEEGLLDGYIASLNDPYSRYLTVEEYERYQKEHSPSGNGTGVRLTRDDKTNAVLIYSVYPSSPAEAAGLRKGDELYRIGEKSVSEMDLFDIAAALSGEIGTAVNVTVKREIAAQILEMEFTVTRGEVKSNDVSYEMLNDTVGYIQLYAITSETPAGFSEALAALDSKGAGSLIIDVRNNLGEDYDAALKMLDQLLPVCDLARVTDHNGKQTVVKGDEKAVLIPMAVLVNSSTVSGAELFAAALRDQAKAILVGETTYGKSADQGVFELDNGSAVLLSNRSFQPPVSESFEEVGVVPDHNVQFDGKKIYLVSHKEDPQIAKALAVLSE